VTAAAAGGAGGGVGMYGGDTISVGGIKPGIVSVEGPGPGGNEGATWPHEIG
jgi:hypothetical protein